MVSFFLAYLFLAFSGVAESGRKNNLLRAWVVLNKEIKCPKLKASIYWSAARGTNNTFRFLLSQSGCAQPDQTVAWSVSNYRAWNPKSLLPRYECWPLSLSAIIPLYPYPCSQVFLFWCPKWNHKYKYVRTHECIVYVGICQPACPSACLVVFPPLYLTVCHNIVWS